jgi:HPt (histidine-containing phosphotransfer) domain-containing protein
MDDFLTKPVDASALRAVLHRWVHDDGRPEPLPRDDPAAHTKETTMTEGLDVKRLDELRDLDPGDTRYLDRAIGNFVANTPTTMATIREAYENGDAENLRQVSHKLAGGALNLGVEEAGRIAQQIELVAGSGAVEGAGELVEALGVALADGRAALLAYQASYST